MTSHFSLKEMLLDAGILPGALRPSAVAPGTFQDISLIFALSQNMIFRRAWESDPFGYAVPLSCVF
jgi:hypothetical protein